MNLIEDQRRRKMVRKDESWGPKGKAESKRDDLDDQYDKRDTDGGSHLQGAKDKSWGEAVNGAYKEDENDFGVPDGTSGTRAISGEEKDGDIDCDEKGEPMWRGQVCIEGRQLNDVLAKTSTGSGGGPNANETDNLQRADDAGSDMPAGVVGETRRGHGRDWLTLH